MWGKGNRGDCSPRWGLRRLEIAETDSEIIGERKLRFCGFRGVGVDGFGAVGADKPPIINRAKIRRFLGLGRAKKSRVEGQAEDVGFGVVGIADGIRSGVGAVEIKIDRVGGAARPGGRGGCCCGGHRSAFLFVGVCVGFVLWGGLP